MSNSYRVMMEYGYVFLSANVESESYSQATLDGIEAIFNLVKPKEGQDMTFKLSVSKLKGAPGA